MKKIFTLFVLLFVVMAMQAVPVKPGLKRTIKLQDGTQFVAELRGDEYGHFWEAQNGKVYVQQNNVFVEANRDEVVEKIQLARRKATLEFEKGAMKPQQPLKSAVQKANGKISTYAPNGADGGAHLVGNKRCLVILAEFQDRKFGEGHNVAFYNRVCNEEGFSEGNFKGSTRDYFKDQSNGQLLIDFDVVGPVTLPENSSYYAGDGGTENAQEFAYRAIKAADENFNVDFSLYDWGNNGQVDEVFIIYAGDNMAEGGTGIWPHKSQTWNTDEGTYYNVDGKRIWVYACTSELNSSGNAAGIGTMCHEFSHCMGFPDLYDVDYKCIDPTTGDTFNGMGRWDLMCSGSYNGDGYQPAGYSGFEKWCARWQYPVALTEDEEFTNVKPMSENGDFYVMYNNGNKNEFYYLENRQQTGWDASLYGSGMLIVHIDNSSKNWSSAPNCKNRTGKDHFCVEPICADGVNDDSYGYRNDPYPYANLDSLTNNSLIAAITYNANSDGRYFMNQAIKNIKRNGDGTMSFKYEAVNKSIIDIDVDGDVVLAETFNGCDGTGGNDGVFSGSGGSGSFKTDVSGWDNGKKNTTDGLQGGAKCAYIAKTTIRTPSFDVNGTYTLQFKAAPWSTQNKDLTLSIDNTDITLSDTQLGLVRGEWTEYTVTLTGTGTARLSLKTNNGTFLLDGFTIYAPSTTGIVSIEDDLQKSQQKLSERIYNINGQYVGTVEQLLPKGVYIRNGKKFVVK